MPLCADQNCLKQTNDLVGFPSYPGSSVMVMLCKACAYTRRLAWLKENRPSFA